MEGQPISAVAPVVEVIRQAERADTVEERFREELKVRGAAVGGHHRKRAKAKSRRRSFPLTELPPGEVVEGAQGVGDAPTRHNASGVSLERLLKSI